MQKYEAFSQLDKIVQKYVKNYQNDYYVYDLNELSSENKSDNYLWIVRTNGTNLIPKEEVATSDTISYYLQHRNSGGQEVKFYEIDTENMHPTIIKDIDAYYESCRVDYEYQKMYEEVETDYDYDY